MRKFAIAGGSLLALVLLVGGVQAATLVSGPQVGDKLPGAFEPLNVTGPTAGEKACLYCRNGLNPVAMIFARDTDEPVPSLIKKIDAVTAMHADNNMGSFVVFLSDENGLPSKLKEIADKDSIQHTIISVMDSAGPHKYEVSRDAEVTVVLYTKHTVKANYAFGKGELKEKDIDKIVADIAKILPKE